MIQFKNERPNPSRFVSIVAFVTLLIILLCLAAKSMAANIAKVDTILCKTECMVKFVSINTKSNKEKTYVIYKDEKNNIEELIPVSTSVLEYITLCKQNGIKPHLGIRLKNNQITSIIKYKPKIK